MLGRSSNGMQPILSHRGVGVQAFAPEGGLDWNDVVSGDGPFSDSNGQHTHCITERAQGRQAKMGKSENNFGGVEFDRGIGQNLGWNDKLWVENWWIFSLLDLLN